MILPLKGSTLSYKNAKIKEMCSGSNVWPMTHSVMSKLYSAFKEKLSQTLHSAHGSEMTKRQSQKVEKVQKAEEDRNGLSKRATGLGQERVVGHGTAMSTLVVHTTKAQLIKDREVGLEEAVRAHNTVAQAEMSTGMIKVNPPDAAHPHTTKMRRTSNKDRYWKK